ncbi:MAG TPA: spore coat U domain-containing protein [Mizugakiibacter sp.]
MSRHKLRRLSSPMARCAVLTAIALGGMCLAAPLRAAQCSIQTSGLTFGTYDPLAPAADAANGTLRLTCNAIKNKEKRNGFSATVTLSAGSSGSYAARTLRTTADTLRYNLYLDAALTTVFGDGTGGSLASSLCYRGNRRDPCGGSGLTSGTPHNVTVYGQIPAGQDVAPGGFIDNLVATVIF